MNDYKSTQTLTSVLGQILKRELLNNGEGKRKGSDYEGDIHINSGSGIVSLMNSKINQTFLNILYKYFFFLIW